MLIVPSQCAITVEVECSRKETLVKSFFIVLSCFLHTLHSAAIWTSSGVLVNYALAENTFKRRLCLVFWMILILMLLPLLFISVTLALCGRVFLIMYCLSLMVGLSQRWTHLDSLWLFLSSYFRLNRQLEKLKSRLWLKEWAKYLEIRQCLFWGFSISKQKSRLLHPWISISHNPGFITKRSSNF